MADVTPLPLPRPHPVRPQVAIPHLQRPVPISAPVRWAFYAFIVSMPVESVPIFGTDVTSFSLAKAFGYIFFAFALTQPLTIFRRPRGAVLAFLAYVAAYIALMFVEPPEFHGMALSRLFKLVQLIVFFWAASRLLGRREIRTRAMLALIAGTTMLAFVQMFAPQVEEDRVTALGENPNTIAMLLALGVATAVGVLHGKRVQSIQLRVGLVGGIMVMVLQMVRTGSRTALVALGVGLLVYVFGAKSIAARFKMMLLVVLALGIAAVTTYKAVELRERWRLSLEEHRISRREIIFPAAVAMIGERPLTGWGPEAHETELAVRVFRENPVEEHNLALFILNEGGLLTGVPYALGFFLCFRGAWRGRKYGAGLAPLAIMVVLLATNMMNVYDNRKVHWLLLALAVSSTPVLPEAARRRTKPLRVVIPIPNSPRRAP